MVMFKRIYSAVKTSSQSRDAGRVLSHLWSWGQHWLYHRMQNRTFHSHHWHKHCQYKWLCWPLTCWDTVTSIISIIAWAVRVVNRPHTQSCKSCCICVSSNGTEFVIVTFRYFLERTLMQRTCHFVHEVQQQWYNRTKAHKPNKWGYNYAVKCQSY